MSNILRFLQNLTEWQKHVFAIFGAVLVTVLLFVIWGTSFIRSDKVSRLVNSASNMASAIDSMGNDDKTQTFIKHWNQVNKFMETVDNTIEPLVDNTDLINTKTKSVNVFVNEPDESYRDLYNTSEQISPVYGENPGDVLY